MSGTGVRQAWHEAVQMLLTNPDEEISKVWKDDENGDPEYCVTVRRTRSGWEGVYAQMPPLEMVMWIDEKELEAIVAMEKNRLGVGT